MCQSFYNNQQVKTQLVICKVLPPTAYRKVDHVLLCPGNTVLDISVRKNNPPCM